MIKIKILECSSKGDKRFSALYAKTTVLGKTDTIENLYQLSKRKHGQNPPKTWKDAKGLKPDYFVIGDKELPLELLSAWYLLLWTKYLDQNPDLVEYARGFDQLNDSFAKPCTNNQARAITFYLRHGRSCVMNMPDVKELIKRLKE